MKFRLGAFGLLDPDRSWVPAGPLPIVVGRRQIWGRLRIRATQNIPTDEAPRFLVKNPSNDAKDIAEELKRNGFDVENRPRNLTATAMRAARGLERLRGASNRVFVSRDSLLRRFGRSVARPSLPLIPVDGAVWTRAGCSPRKRRQRGPGGEKPKLGEEQSNGPRPPPGLGQIG